MIALIGIAGGKDDPNVAEVRIVRSGSNTMFRVFAPRYVWKCYNFLLSVGYNPKLLIDQIQKWATELELSFETYFTEGILYAYHQEIGSYD